MEEIAGARAIESILPWSKEKKGVEVECRRVRLKSPAGSWEWRRQQRSGADGETSACKDRDRQRCGQRQDHRRNAAFEVGSFIPGVHRVNIEVPTRIGDGCSSVRGAPSPCWTTTTEMIRVVQTDRNGRSNDYAPKRRPK